MKMILKICLVAMIANVIAESSSAYDDWFPVASSTFATDFYQKLIETSTGNIIISPFSIQSAATLTMFGATGTTYDEMLKGLKYTTDYSRDSIAKNFETFSDYARSYDGFRILNKIYVQNNFTIKPYFNVVATKSFNAQAQSLDFTQAKESAATINEWAAEFSNNKITSLVTPDLIADASMVLINGIYFKGVWAKKFVPAYAKEKFHLNNDNAVEVEAMQIREMFNYIALPDLDASAVELPYENSDISMLIILPNKVDGLPQLEANLNSINFAGISKSMTEKKVFLQMPKFKIEYEIDLAEPLQKMGLKKMFTSAAEFGELLEGNVGVEVSKAIHKAVIEVNEDGAEAAAFTLFTITPLSDGPDREVDDTIQFIANHPFMFALVKGSAAAEKLVLFSGRVQQF